MSKQTEAKERQNYTPKAIPQTCVNCANFTADKVNRYEKYMGQTGVEAYWEDTNMRCGIGGFAVKKMGTCNEFAGKPL